LSENSSSGKYKGGGNGGQTECRPQAKMRLLMQSPFRNTLHRD
jgi:hypothetical protein